MSQGTFSTARSRPLEGVLAERGALPAADALTIFRQLLAAVRALHADGRIHRAIGPDAVHLDSAGDAVLAAPDPVREFDGSAADAECCPPELFAAGVVRLPAEIEAARKELLRAGVALDPRRIDVYQLGALLCRMTTGESVAAYLRSPRTKSKVPTTLRPLIDRALGYRAAGRIADCDEYAAVLSEAEAGREQSIETPPHGSAAGFPSNTPPGGAGSPTGSPSSASAGLPFARLAHYRIDERIGRGGMGEVYLGFEESLQRRVAIKVLPAELGRDEEFVRRFRAEATAAARLTHPNIVPIHFIGQEAGHHFFAMQYVQGESLDRLLARRNRLPVDEAVGILEQCLAGLGAAHHAGLIHRDVKPGNILLDARTGRALVADFGLVKTAGDGHGMTATGVVLGTVDYIAPEQARGRPVDGRADLYALGVLAFQMLSGRLPFRAETPSAMIFQHAYETPPPLHEVAPDVPGPLAAVVDRLMAKDPSARHQSCEEVLEDLRRWRAGEPLAESAGATPSERPSRVIRAPDFAAAPELPLGSGSAAPMSWWSSLRDRALGWLHAKVPDVLERLQNTGQQVDTALAEYQRRRDRLAGLVVEATESAEELAAQAKNHRDAAAAARRVETGPDEEAARRAAREREECERVAADLDAQAAEQREQVARMRRDLDKVDGTLGRLRSQRDLLRGRLRVAEARLRMEGGSPRPLFRRRLAVAAVVGLGILMAGGLFFALAAWHTSPPAPIPAPGVDPSISQTLPILADQPVYVIHALKSFTGHTDAVVSVALSPDGRRIISGGKDKTMRMWDVATGAQLYSKAEKKFWIECVAFTPDGAQAISGGDDPFRLHLWNVESGQVARQFQGHTAIVMCVTFSSDGRQALSGGGDQILRLWDTATGGEVRELKGHTAAVHCVAISPDGRQALSGGEDQAIRLWNMATGKTIRLFEGPWPRVLAVAFSADGRQVVSVGNDKAIRVWDLESAQEQKTFLVNRIMVTAAALSRDGRRALVVSGHGTIHLWDVESEKEIARLEGHSPGVFCVAFSPDGRYAVSGGMDKTVRLWDLTSKPGDAGQPTVPVIEEKPKEEITNSQVGPLALPPGDTVTAAAFSRDGRRLVVGDTKLRLWDLEHNKQIHDFGGTEYGPAFHDFSGRFIVGSIRAVAWSADGRRVLMGGSDVRNGRRGGVAILYEADSGKVVQTFIGHPTSVCAVALSSDGSEILTAGDSPRDPRTGLPVMTPGNPSQEVIEVRRWDVASGKELGRYRGLTAPTHSVAFSPDGKRIFAGGSASDRAVYSWEVGSPEGQRGAIEKGVRDDIVLRPDVSKAVFLGTDWAFRIYDLKDGNQLKEICHSEPLARPPKPAPMNPVWSRDGRFVACSTWQYPKDPGKAPIYIVDAVSGRVVRTLEGHRIETTALAISDDGRFVFSSSADGSRLWDVTSKQ